MTPVYAKKLGLQIQKINIGAQKTDRSNLNIFEMAIASFQVQDKLRWVRFFQETFLVSNTRINIVFRIYFLTLSNADIWFVKEDLT